MNSEHEKCMKRALELAALGRGRTSPNPMVGSVIVKGDAIIGEGWHHGAGLAHAEIEALKAAGEAARGATLYVNLEPCSHQGRTPPCAPAVVRAGIATVVAGMTDPNPMVAGRGIALLRESGVEVITNVLENECRNLNRAFVKVMTKGLPRVILKSAMTLDGKTASYTGDSKWISSEESRLRVHKLRGEVDAVIVGTATMLKDDPSLTSRVPESEKIKDPYRVVMDERLLTPPESNFVKLAGDGKTVIMTTETASAERESELARRGCRVIRVPADSAGQADAEAALRKLVELGANYVMVEGGGTLNFSFLQRGLIDSVMIFIAPKLLGGRNAITFLEGEGFDSISKSIPIKISNVSISGGDVIVEAEI
jgi:diaminohydroxyphosphoribosylaminopyrimidine deaminase / 5-amino-6-(5-phosphoribosylamino)uracil reductase